MELSVKNKGYSVEMFLCRRSGSAASVVRSWELSDSIRLYKSIL